ncbi:MAG TPA: (4Fe-4S)-binding protein [bacterium (Candidatus Stahlbacteria)]|nr:(4Fe-4S)-binding protein [Candidatus Stahlbacteria bacterium]
MKKIAVISGKGGTGKTVITASLVALAKRERKVVSTDCDVDAPDLHLLLKPEIRSRYRFSGLPQAKIDEEKCNRCGQCVEVCRFDAVSKEFRIDPIACEGCRFCYYVCPTGAIKLVESLAGEYFVSETRYGPMVHGQLRVAEQNSGRLVTLIRNQAQKIAESEGFDLVVIDGPPGIGCPTIASLAGIDLAIVVTEPTLTAIHDLKRAISLTGHFGITTAVVINKFDLNDDNLREIEIRCGSEGLEVLGRIPFDPIVPKSIVAGVPLVEYTAEGVATSIGKIYSRIKESL